MGLRNKILVINLPALKSVAVKKLTFEKAGQKIVLLLDTLVTVPGRIQIHHRN